MTFIEIADVGETLASVRDHPDADAGGLGRREGLDRALEDADLGVAMPGRVGLDLLAGLRISGDPPREVKQLRHRRSLRR